MNSEGEPMDIDIYGNIESHDMSTTCNICGNTVLLEDMADEEMCYDCNYECEAFREAYRELCEIIRRPDTPFEFFQNDEDTESDDEGPSSRFYPSAGQ